MNTRLFFHADEPGARARGSRKYLMIHTLSQAHIGKNRHKHTHTRTYTHTHTNTHIYIITHTDTHAQMCTN